MQELQMMEAMIDVLQERIQTEEKLRQDAIKAFGHSHVITKVHEENIMTAHNQIIILMNDCLGKLFMQLNK